MFHKILDKYIRRLLDEYIQKVIFELSPEKSYILILPNNVDLDEIKVLFSKMDLKTNIIAIRADDVRIIELE